MENQDQNNFSNQPEQNTPTYYANPAVGQAGAMETPVTVQQWLLFWLVSLINVIPVIGTIIYFIFILYVAFKKDSRFPVSMQNFCKAYLVLIAVGIVLAIVFAGTLTAMLFSIAGMGY